jgi:hypothetical protein
MPANDPRGTDGPPLIVKVQPSPQTDEEAAKEQDQIDRQESAERWTRGLGFITAIVGFLQLVAIGLQVRIAGRQNRLFRSQNAIIEAQSSIMDAQRATNEATLATMREIERAYVTMSHQLPGIEPKSERVSAEDNRWRHRLTVGITVQNNGNTPARVTRCLIQVVMTNDDFPAVPDYNESLARPGYVSLVKDDSYTISTPYEFHSTGTKSFSAAFRELAVHGHRLYVIGYVDYTDKFDDRHRAGYGRIYEPAIDDQNRPEYYSAIAVTETGILARMQERSVRFDMTLYQNRSNLILLTKPGYNYDRPRVKGEGNDWDEKS